jgi:hypothetical protein
MMVFVVLNHQNHGNRYIQEEFKIMKGMSGKELRKLKHRILNLQNLLNCFIKYM